uniref:GRF-type domain-containing protein n=1 Tax=Aegilops tauschii TaxID=37682 RepID=M8B6W7_AEGTA
MASSSSSVRSRITMCPDCGKVQVETNISGIEGPNFGKHLYKCPIDSGPDKCGWFKWEEPYAGILRRHQVAALQGTRLICSRAHLSSG